MFPFLMLAAALIMGYIVMLLWNLILPDLTNVKPIRYWQAVGLLALCRILLGNFGAQFRNHRNWREELKNKTSEENTGQDTFEPRSWRGKWMGMSHEERVQFREEMRKRCRK
ncbi:hypothetical protein [Dyadobacter sp. CY312]|uniref:hypothetical protein n=1 Tax=Dyadobacter sp. CY312 TaxID=2907303 RepID=UPI001F1DE4C5|nr:hypothetical protein [Dyadobacter sp. CY312]MCE7042592.1 hypothetical protein [Dyadobacter sp. CY312]